MATFFASTISYESSDFFLSEEESKHCIRVLRYTIGATVHIIDGKGNEFIGEIIDDHPKRCKLKVVEVIKHPKPVNSIHVAMAPTKNMDRVEWFLEKAVELGLSRLTFLKCDNNERNSINTERLQKIAISAMKQSKRYFLPEIESLVSLSQFLETNPIGYIGHCSQGEKIQLAEIKNIGPFLIGPEGDFSEREVDIALKAGYTAVHMSDFRLRTETAALTAVFGLNYFN